MPADNAALTSAPLPSSTYASGVLKTSAKPPVTVETGAKTPDAFRDNWEAARRAVIRDREAAKGHLYFIRCGDAVKIGRTTNIVRRLANMQVNTPHEIDCLLLLKGHGKEERSWHKAYAHCRIHGEWYHLTPELDAAIRECREEQAATGRSFPPMFAAVL